MRPSFGFVIYRHENKKNMHHSTNRVLSRYQIVERTKVKKQERLLIKERSKVEKQDRVVWKVDERIVERLRS